MIFPRNNGIMITPLALRRFILIKISCLTEGIEKSNLSFSIGFKKLFCMAIKIHFKKIIL